MCSVALNLMRPFGSNHHYVRAWSPLSDVVVVDLDTVGAIIISTAAARELAEQLVSSVAAIIALQFLATIVNYCCWGIA